jgi:hypothetical protein
VQFHAKVLRRKAGEVNKCGKFARPFSCKEAKALRIYCKTRFEVRISERRSARDGRGFSP